MTFETIGRQLALESSVKNRLEETEQRVIDVIR